MITELVIITTELTMGALYNLTLHLILNFFLIFAGTGAEQLWGNPFAVMLEPLTK
jgi:hypothetical protein